MMGDLTIDLKLDEETKDVLRRMDLRIQFLCATNGHRYHSDVIGIDGTICVRCGERPAEGKERQMTRANWSISSTPCCVNCALKTCREPPGQGPFPGFCPTEKEPELLAKAQRVYQNPHCPDVRNMALAAARVEAEGYMKWSRVEETIAFAQRIGAKRLGIAYCVRLEFEAGLLYDLLAARCFDEIVSVCCKVGAMEKESIGLTDGEKVHPDHYEVACNPIAQAMLLNDAETDLNILIGLCVGHDALFIAESSAPVTVLIVKDRPNANYPALGLYKAYCNRP